MIANIITSCSLCDKAIFFVGETCNGNYQFEITKCICITIVIIAALAVLLYLLKYIIDLLHESHKVKKQQKIERKDKERQLLIDYRNKYLNFLKDNNENELYKTAITDIINDIITKFHKDD